MRGSGLLTIALPAILLISCGDAAPEPAVPVSTAPVVGLRPADGPADQQIVRPGEPPLEQPETDSPPTGTAPTEAELAEVEPRRAAAETARLLASFDREGCYAFLAEHLREEPGDSDCRRLLGDMAYDDERWALADTHLTLALAAVPDDGRLRLRATRAKAWLTAQGKAAYGRRALYSGYIKAARLLPEDDEPLRLLVKLYPAGSPLAIDAMDAVIADQPDAVRARLRKAEVFLARDPPDLDAARGELAVARFRAPESPDVLACEAAVLVEMGRNEQAVDGYARALERLGGRGADVRDLARISNALDALLHPGDPEQDIDLDVRMRAADALCAANPGSPRFGNNAGLWSRDEARDYEASLQYYEQALDAAPDDLDLLADTAFLYLNHLRDWKDQSLPLLERVRRLVEDDGAAATRGYWDALDHLCRYYFEVGRYEDVIACADLRAAAAGKRFGPGSAPSWRKRAQAALAR